MIEKLGKCFEHVAVDGNLSVLIASCKDVTKGTQGGHSNDHVRVAQKLAKTWNHVALEEDKDALVATLIRDVAQSPADVIENLRVVRLVEHAGEGWNSSSHLFESRTWPTLA